MASVCRIKIWVSRLPKKITKHNKLYTATTPVPNHNLEVYNKISFSKNHEKNRKYITNQRERKNVNSRKKNPEIFFCCLHTINHAKHATNKEIVYINK
jgi:hypothetical protein